MGDILNKAIERARAEGRVRPTKTLQQLGKESDSVRKQLNYNIDTKNFDDKDLEEWASKHNYVKVIDAEAGVRYEPKKENSFLGIGGKKLTTPSDEGEFKKLNALANKKRNQREREEHPATVAALDALAAGGKSFYSGISNMSTGIYNAAAKAGDIVLNPILATKDYIQTGNVKNEYNVLSNSDFIKWQNAENDKLSNAASAAMQKYGIAGTVADSLIRSTAEMLPSVFLVAASGGASVVPTLMTEMNGMAAALKIPTHMIPSFISAIGNNYHGAKKDGAGDNAASLYAVTSAYITTMLESGGLEADLANGAQKAAPKNLWNALGGFAKDTMLPEGLEEVEQNISDKAIRKTIVDKNAPFFSFRDDNAVINPRREAESFALGSAAGGVFGGLTGQFKLPGKTEQGPKSDAESYLSPEREATPDSPADDLTEKPSSAKSAAEVDRIIKDPVLSADFEAKSGISLAGMTNSEKRKAVKGYFDKSETILEASDAESTDVTASQPAKMEDKFDSESSIELEKNVEDYTYNQKTVLKDYINSVNNDVLEEVNRKKSDEETGFKRISLGKVGQKAALGFKRLTGIDVSNYTFAINSNAIRHILKRHGPDGKHDRSMSKAEDIARVGYILNNYDDMSVLRDEEGKIIYSSEFNGADGTPSPLFLCSKKINGTYYAVVAAAENRYKKLWAVTSYISKKKEDITQVLHDEISVLGTTSETPLASLSSEVIISNPETVVKENNSTGDIDGKYTLSDKVDLSSVRDLLSADDVRITDSIVLSDFLAKRFGIRIKYINDPAGRFCGKYDSGTIFINLAKLGNKSSFEVLAHEFGHAFRVINPKGYRELFVMVKNSTALSHRYAEFRNRVKKTYEGLLDEKYDESKIDDLAFEELLSECFAETFKNPDSLRKITESDPKLYAKMRQIILDLIEKVKNFFAGRKNENIRRIVGDFEAIEKRIVEIVSESDSGLLKNNTENDIISDEENQSLGARYLAREDSRRESGAKLYGEKSAGTPNNRIKYSPKGINLPYAEKKKFISSTSTDYYMAYKTHKGLQYQSCVTDEAHILYIYEDGGFGKYKVVARIDYADDLVAEAVVEVLENEPIYRITDVVNAILKTFEARRCGYSLYNAYTGKRSSSRGFRSLSEKPSASNARGIDASGGRSSRNGRGNEGRARGDGRVNYMPEGGYDNEWSQTTKKNVKDISGLVDMSGNVSDTSRIPTKRKLTNTKAKVLSSLELIDRQIEGCREIMRDPTSPAYKKAEAQLEKLYAERDELTSVGYKTEVLEELRGSLDGADVPRHTKFIMDNASEICKVSDGLAKRLVRSTSFLLTDFERNMKAIFGEKYAYIKEHYVDPLMISKAKYAKAVRDLARETSEKMNELGIKYKSREDAAIMWIGEGEKAPDLKNSDDLLRLEQKMRNMGYRDDEIASHRAGGFRGVNLKIAYSEADLYRDFGTERGQAIIEAARFFREKYDKLIDEINLSQAKIYPNRTDKLVKKRKDYFHHFQEMSQGFGALKNIFTNDMGIDPTLAGTSEFTNPKEKWAGFKKQRTGNKTEESAIGGFAKYIGDAEYAIHINEHIEKIRGLARDIAEAKALEGDTGANAAIIYLKDYANSLAGKTFLIDRIVDRLRGGRGRKTLAAIGWFNTRAKANAILGNISTLLVQPTNMLNTLQLIEHEGDIAKGISEFVAGLNENSEIAERYRQSGFLSERYLDKEMNKLTGNSGGLFGKLTGKDLSVWLGAALNVGDELGTKISWNAFYNEALRKGEANPSMYADEKTRAAVAGRGIGETPIAFNSKILGLFLPYRLEVNNNVHVIKDMLSSDKSAGFKIKKSLEFMIASGLMSFVLEAITGNGSVFDPLGAIIKGAIQGSDEAEEQEEGTGKAVKLGLQYATQNLLGEVVSNHPLGQVVITTMGVDSDMLDKLTNGNAYIGGGVGVPAAGVISNALKKGSLIGGTIEAALGFGTPFGGNQIKKTAKGIGELERGGAYEKDVLSGKAKGNLKYLVEPSIGNVAKEVLFGPSSLGKSEKYYDGKLPKLDERETALIDGNESFDERKAEYEKIAEGKKASKEKEMKKENKKKRKVTEYIRNTKADDPGYELYKKGFKDALPICVVPDSIEWTENKKEYSKTLTSAEQTRWQKELDALVRSNYNKTIASKEFKNAKLDEKEKLIKSAVSDALSAIKKKIKAER